MDALEFLRERRRMCNSYRNCEGCPLEDGKCVVSDVVPDEDYKRIVTTVDAVVVTRCKDCKHLRVWNQKDLYAFCPKTNFVFLPFQADTRTHFCSLGEPKET